MKWQIAGAIALLVCLVFVQRADSRDAIGAPATMAYAKSGNTLELLNPLSSEFPVTTIRLTGIQAPDARQKPWGPTARECLSQYAEKSIRVEADGLEADRYGRLWAYVWAGDILINAALLEQGCAYLHRDRLSQLRYGQQMVYAQESARLRGVGIWSATNPLRQPPDAFRQSLETS